MEQAWAPKGTLAPLLGLQVPQQIPFLDLERLFRTLEGIDWVINDFQRALKGA